MSDYEFTAAEMAVHDNKEVDHGITLGRAMEQSSLTAERDEALTALGRNLLELGNAYGRYGRLYLAIHEIATEAAADIPEDSGNATARLIAKRLNEALRKNIIEG